MRKLIDKNSKISDVEYKSDTISAIEEVAKTKGIKIDLKDDMTMGSIAQLLGIDEMDLLLIANKKNGMEEEFFEAYPEQKKSKKAQDGDKPQWINENEIVELDVRPSLAKGVDPFGLIMQTISQIDGKVLKIINSFETTPLYNVLGKQGFEHFSENLDGVWHIYFYKNR